MMRTSVLLFVALFVAAEAVTPVQKVIEMLNSMAAKGKAEKEEEIASYKEFAKFCQGAEQAKVRSIEENTAVVGKLEGEIGSLNLEVDELAAAIAKSDADIGVLAEKIANLDTMMDGLEGEEADLTAERKEEHAIFEKKDGDYSASVDALDRAVATMDKVTLLQKPAERREALIQISSDRKLPSKARTALQNYLKRDPEVSLLQLSQPTGEAAAYESQSGGIKELFEGLEGKLSDERSAGQSAEAEEKHTYDMMMLQLNDQLKNAKADREKKAANKAATEQALADAEGQKADTEKALAEDRKYLAELKAECEAKRKAFEERQATRQGEIEAIGQAVEILSGSAVSGAAATHLPAMLQTSKRGIKSSFAQLRSSLKSPLQQRVAAFLQEQATTTRSTVLSTVAERVAQDPFAKINKMIKDMIAKLIAEANEESEHKAFCDEELGANKATRDEKTETVDSLNAEIEQLTAEENKLSQDISSLSATVEDLSKALADATELRTSEKAKNAATVADAKAAQTAVGQATTVLKEFYAKAAQASGGYGGSQDSASGVMNFLEVVLSDFTRLEEETTANEGQAADDFSAFSAETNAAIDANNGDIKQKTTKKTMTANSLQQAKEDLRNTQAELSAAFEYYDKLKPDCVDSGISYEERVARRKAEIESLKEAVGILDGTTVSV